MHKMPYGLVTIVEATHLCRIIINFIALILIIQIGIILAPKSQIAGYQKHNN